MFYNLSKEDYIKSFKYDYVFMDAFHNVNFLVLESENIDKKEIEKIIASEEYTSIRLLNDVLLNKYGLYIVGKTIPIRNVYFFEIVEYKKYKEEIENNIKNNNLD